MNFHLKINESSQFNGWSSNKNNFKLNKKALDNIVETPEQTEIKDFNLFKDQIINLQDNVKNAQEKINVLQMASDILTDISGNLNDLKDLSIAKFNANNEVELSSKIQTSSTQIDNIQKLQAKMNDLLDVQDNDSQTVLTEFKNASEKASKYMKASRKDENIEDVITTVSHSKESLNKLKEGLINNIQSLNVTLENMISVDSRIRNVELANKVVNVAHNQILNQATKSIIVQVKDTDNSINSLIN